MTLNLSSEKTVTLFVCITCGTKEKQREANRNGTELHAALVQEKLPDNVRLQHVKCLGGCDNPAAVAFTGTNKFTYMFGDLPTGPRVSESVAAIMDYLNKYLRVPDGLVGKPQRPALFTKVLVRVPPPFWESVDGKVNIPAVADTTSPEESGSLQLAPCDGAPDVPSQSSTTPR
jgi:predicted metal-binding protein